MANFLGNIGAAFRGQQEYQTYLDQQEANKLAIETKKATLQEYQDQAAQAKAQRARQGSVDQTTLDFLASIGQGIPPPPQPQPPPQQPPAPGQQSVPMIQPGQQPPQGPPQRPMPPQQQGPQEMPQGGPMPPQMPPGGPQMRQGGQHGPMPAQPPIPPYQTVGGGPGGPPQQPQGIPAPPPQQEAGPPPNSLTLKDAAAFIKKQGITDPIAGMQILEKLTPYLNNEAKQEAAMLKMQLQQQQQAAVLQEKYYALEKASQDKALTREQQFKLQTDGMEIKKMLGLMGVAVAQQNANTRASTASQEAGGKNMDDGAVDAAAWNYLLRGTSPPARGGMYQATMKHVAEIAKENGMSVQELTSASADVKTKLAAKKNFEVRAQNMERAENQILSEIPVMKDAMAKLDLSSIPKLAEGGIWLLRQKGDPRITTLDQAAETVFNEFQGIITGNPGTLNVSDVAKAEKNYHEAKTLQQMAAAIAGMERIMGNAKKAMAKTRTDIMKDINDSVGKREKPAAGSAPSLPAGWSVETK